MSKVKGPPRNKEFEVPALPPKSPTNDKGGPGAILLPMAQPLGLQQIQARIREQALGIEKHIAYIKGLAVGSEAGADIIKEIEKLEKSIEEIRK